MIGKGLRQRLVRAVRLGDDHDAAGVLVEAVDDARPLDAADARQAVAAMVDQRVDQRAGPVAGAGMHHQPGRLVDDDQLGILVEDVERDVLALGLRGLRLGQRRPLPSRPPSACVSGSMAGLPPTVTAPRRISAWTRLLEKSAPSSPASHWSSLALAASGPASSRRGAAAGRSAPVLPGRLRYQGRASGIRILITMARPALGDEEEKPLDPAVENVRRKLVRFVAINLGLLFIALMAVVGALVYKSRTTLAAGRRGRNSGAVVPQGVVEGQIPLPAGAKIVSQSLSGSRLSLSLELPGRQPRHLPLRSEVTPHRRAFRGGRRMSAAAGPTHRHRGAGRRRL